jgi:hypothetical protein
MKYVLENPRESVGERIGWGAWNTTYPEVVAAFKKTTGKDAVFRDVSQEEWFESMGSRVWVRMWIRT